MRPGVGVGIRPDPLPGRPNPDTGKPPRPGAALLGRDFERAEVLDLVEGELHPDRLVAVRREDVHDPAPTGEIPW